MQNTAPRYVPRTKGEIIDHLGMMMLTSPRFEDKTGYSPDQDIEMVFLELTEGLKAIRNRLDEKAYEQLIELSVRMRAHFEADPEDATEDGIKGRECIAEMEDILRATGRRKR